jgi:hypothetical protein
MEKKKELRVKIIIRNTSRFENEQQVATQPGSAMWAHSAGCLCLPREYDGSVPLVLGLRMSVSDVT